MSDIHIYLERTHPIRVITLEPTGARGPIGPQGPAGAAGPNSVTSSTTSNGTCDLWLDTLNVGIGTASGLRSVALGQSTASGNLSFAQGLSTASEDYAFASGDGSVASGYASFAVNNSTASGDLSFSAGGGTIASGDYSTAIGLSSEATAPYSVAIGRRAKAIYQGSSVEADSQDADVESLLTNEKTFRFANGYKFFGGSATFEADVTVDGILYADHIHGNLAGSVYAHVRAGEALAKGDPVYVSGSHGTGANLIPIVSKADASNIAKMPAVGIMDAALANNASGHMVITGTIFDLNTAAYSVNATLYVATGGGLTATPPAANSQPVARVDRSNANNGALIVSILSNASNGGNGSGDANKLVRFSSAGLIPVASIGGLGTDVATFLATPTSANLAAAVTDETGTGSLVFKSEFANQSGLLFFRSIITSPVTTTFNVNITPFGTVNLAANKTYRFEMYLPVTAANSGRTLQSIGGNAPISYKSYQSTHNITAETANTTQPTVPSSFGLQGATSTLVSKVTGILRTTGTGTFIFNFSCDQGNPNGTATLRAGAYFEIYEIN
jgi:hypothetical protein